MIDNPRLGMRVRIIQYMGQLNPDFAGRIGVITNISISHISTHIKIELDELVYGERTWTFRPQFLEPIILSPEEQAQLEDQQRRKKHAEKYL